MNKWIVFAGGALLILCFGACMAANDTAKSTEPDAALTQEAEEEEAALEETPAFVIEGKDASEKQDRAFGKTRERNAGQSGGQPSENRRQRPSDSGGQHAGNKRQKQGDGSREQGGLTFDPNTVPGNVPENGEGIPANGEELPDGE